MKKLWGTIIENLNIAILIIFSIRLFPRNRNPLFLTIRVNLNFNMRKTEYVFALR